MIIMMMIMVMRMVRWLSPAHSAAAVLQRFLVTCTVYTTKQINLCRKLTCDKAATMGNNGLLVYLVFRVVYF